MTEPVKINHASTNYTKLRLYVFLVNVSYSEYSYIVTHFCKLQKNAHPALLITLICVSINS